MRIYRLSCFGIVDKRLDQLTGTRLSEIAADGVCDPRCTDADDCDALKEQAAVIIEARAQGHLLRPR